jgi:hypothetical protein
VTGVIERMKVVVAVVGVGDVIARVTGKFMWANHHVNKIRPFVWYDVLCLVREDAAVGNRDGGRERDGRAGGIEA